MNLFDIFKKKKTKELDIIEGIKVFLDYNFHRFRIVSYDSLKFVDDLISEEKIKQNLNKIEMFLLIKDKNFKYFISRRKMNTFEEIIRPEEFGNYEIVYLINSDENNVCLTSRGGIKPYKKDTLLGLNFIEF